MLQLTLVAALLRARYVLLLALSAALCLGSVQRVTPNSDWHFFAWGGGLLFGVHKPLVRTSFHIDPILPGGLHLYGNYEFLQIGPPALVVARGIDLLPGSGIVLSAAVVQSLGLLTVYAIDRAFARPRDDVHRLGVLLGGAFVTVAWGSLTHFRHLDDAMTLAALAGAVWALRAGRPIVAGLLLGLSATCKPWGVVVLVLCMAPLGRRGKTACVATSLLVPVICWGPFALADHGTLLLGQVQLGLSPASALAVVRSTPVGSGQILRLLQFGVGTGLALALVARGRWAWAPLAAFALRLAIEPSAYAYYASGIVAAAFLVDMASRRYPWLTSVTFTGWVLTQVLPATDAARVRLVEYTGLLLVCAVCLFFRPQPRETGSMELA